MKEKIRRDAHKDIDHIFKELLPAQGLPERPEQTALSHRMLDVMLNGGIALCDAGTGIGKTYAYLTAGIIFQQSRLIEGKPVKPILISTSSIALQKTVRDEYLPFLSAVLMADGMITESIQAVIRKGKAHYVCDERLERRLGQLDLSKKNWKSGNALLSLRKSWTWTKLSISATTIGGVYVYRRSAIVNEPIAVTAFFWTTVMTICIPSRYATTIF